MSDLTPELVQQFYADATQHFGCSVIDKADSKNMKAVAVFLDAIKVTDRDDFMTRFTTTIFDDIYIPFDVGDAGDYSLVDQVDILVHELVHVQQFRDDRVGFTVGYLLHEAARAEYEAVAYSADMEMHFWRTGEIYDIRARAQLLSHYALEADEIDFAANWMESIAMTIQAGAAVNDVAVWAMDWMEQHGVEGAAANG